MFDVGWQELFVIAIVMVVVMGPKDLPQAIRAMVAVIRKLRSMAGEFQRGVDEVVREAELDELRKNIAKTTAIDVAGEVEKLVDPKGEIARGAGIAEIREAITGDAAASAAPTADDGGKAREG